MAIPLLLPSGVWSVSHQDLGKIGADDQGHLSLVGKEVHFLWKVSASSAFVTGDFSNWEVTLPMKKVQTTEGDIWVASKTLPPGSFQYKFIIDNNWRYAEDQPIVHDERGIINNYLTVTVDSCGDESCFCWSYTTDRPASSPSTDNDSDGKQSMTPGTMKVFQMSTGVAYTYTERNRMHEVKKSYMHKQVNDQPFDVVVVNVNNMKKNPDLVLPKDGMISRASSFDDVSKSRMRYDPTLSVVRDAVYEAALRADENGSIPHTAPGYARLPTNDPKEFTYSVRARLSNPALGFNPKECHSGIELLENNHYAIRHEAKGLYKTVRSSLSILRRKQIYFEMYIAKQGNGGGVCVGLSTRELPLTCLVGTRPNSIGFSTTGNIIQTKDGKESWTALGRVVEEGSVIGCLVMLTDVNGEKTKEDKAQLTFFVDGENLGAVEYSFVGGMEIFPTLSLFSRDGRVFSVFSANDMMYGYAIPADVVDAATLDGNEVIREIDKSPCYLEVGSLASYK